MRVKLFLTMAMTFCTLTISAQSFRYENVQCRASMKSYDPQQKDTVYLTNDVSLSLPKSCSNSDIDVEKINESLLRDLFLRYYKSFASAELIQQNIGRVPIDEEFESFNWQPCAKVGNKVDSKHFVAQLNSRQRGFYKGACFFENILKVHTGGAHGLTSHWTVAIDLSTGNIADPDYFFTHDEQKAIMRMLSNGTNVRKYIVNGTGLTTEDCKAIADGIKEELDSSDFLFPTFYVNQKKFHFLFNQEEIGPYNLGAPELLIPESVITRVCQSVADK